MNADDARPIWVRLVEGFRSRIVSGQWPPSARIPSVRELALDAGVNPNTIQRALGELDREGLTVAERAQGRFVTSDEIVIERARTRIAEDATDVHIRALLDLGLDLDTGIDLLTARWNRAANDRRGGDRR